MFPEDLPQERVINIFYYLNKYGWGILDAFAAMLRAHSSESHIILEL
ncbi:MAG: bacillithiol biosynthesis BshC [Chlorobium sp.]|nr:bacillithiol biosynthesis BshC [Chlorobium sp.]